MDENTARWLAGMSYWAEKINALTIAFNSGQITNQQYIDALEEGEPDD